VQALWLQHHASLSSPSFCPKKIFKTVSSSLKPSTVAQVAPAEARGIYWMSMCEGVEAAAPFNLLQFIILFKIKSGKYSAQ
jgi:hypothetical protein